MQPVPISEKHLVFKPLQQPAPPGRLNANQAVGSQMKSLQGQMNGDLFYLKIAGEVNGAKERLNEQPEGDADSRMEEVKNGERRAEDRIEVDECISSLSIFTIYPVVTSGNTPSNTIPTTWTLQFRDLPDPSGRRPVTSRLMADIPITGGDPLAFMKAMEYSLISTSYLRGHRLTHNAIDIRLYQPLLEAPSKPIDPSGAYVLQTAVKVADGQNMERMQEGVRQLVELKEMLRGVVELEMGERLWLDTRVR